MIVDESWIGVKAEAATEGGVFCHSWQNTATTHVPRVSASTRIIQTFIVRTKLISKGVPQYLEYGNDYNVIIVLTRFI